ncbi:MAG: MCE family protein [Myxococcaceae bacterium]|nr:MCE family protein [Myxococcaceae bacterium]
MSRSAAIGLFILAGLVIAAWFVLRIQGMRIGETPGIDYVVELPDAEGLQPKAWVLYKGVRVGRVTGVSLSGEGVAVRVTMQSRLDLREGTRARIVNVGLLGEKNLELLAGPPDAPPLPQGGHIRGVPAPSLDRALDQANAIGANVEAITGDLRRAVGGPDGGSPRMEELLQNLTELTAVLKEAVAENRHALRGSLDEAREASRAITVLAQHLTDLADRQSSQVDRTADNVVATSESLRRAAATLESLAAKLDHGEGAVGRLVSDPETGQRFDDALDSVKTGADAMSHLAEGARQVRLGVGIRGDYLAAHGRGKGYFGAMLTGQSLSLKLEVVNAPLALVSVAGAPRADEEAERIAWTAQVGYRFGFFRVRSGLNESRVGAGADVFLLEERLRLSADLWDLSRAGLRPHVRLEAAVTPWRPIFLVGGWDDALNPGQGDSVFIGAGLQFGR